MFILRELILDPSSFKYFFIYFNEIFNANSLIINYDKILPHHIIIFDHTHLNTNSKHFRNNKNKWIKIAEVVKDFINKMKINGHRTCVFIGDCHEYTFINGLSTIVNACKLFEIDYIVGVYENNKEIDELIVMINNSMNKTKYIPLNNVIRSDIFRDYNLPKIYDIVFYGKLNSSYPLRQKIYNILKSKRFMNKFNIKIINFRAKKDEDLALVLNSSYMAVATSSKFNYLVKKYFEISASNCLIMGDMPDQGKKIFGNNYVSINIKMSANEIYKKIKYMLNHKDQILKRSRINHDKVHKDHSIEMFHKRLLTNILMN